MCSLRRMNSINTTSGREGGIITPQHISHSSFSKSEFNILKYIETSDITTARKIGVVVKKIIFPCGYNYKMTEEIYHNFLSWVRNGNALIHKECCVHTSNYGDRDYDTVYYFNKFKVFTNTDGGPLTSFAFGELDDYEINVLRKNGIKINTEIMGFDNDLDMIKIAYGIVRKYPGSFGKYEWAHGIFGIVPSF